MFVIWVMAVVVRLANVAAMPLEPGLLLGEDAWLYWANALSLLEHGTFADPASSGRMPGYFLLVAGGVGVVGAPPLAGLGGLGLLVGRRPVLVGGVVGGCLCGGGWGVVVGV